MKGRVADAVLDTILLDVFASLIFTYRQSWLCTIFCFFSMICFSIHSFMSKHFDYLSGDRCVFLGWVCSDVSCWFLSSYWFWFSWRFLWFLELRADRILFCWKFNFPFYWIGELKVIWLCMCVSVVFSWCSKFVRIENLIDDDCFRFFVELWDVRLMSVCLIAFFCLFKWKNLSFCCVFGTICFCICACWYFEIFAPREKFFSMKTSLCHLSFVNCSMDFLLCDCLKSLTCRLFYGQLNWFAKR